MTGNTVKSSKGIVGAWLLHHDQKLIQSNTTEFENIALAGRSSRLLSVISKEQDWAVSSQRVEELARGIGIRKLELPALLGELSDQGLIDQGTNGVSVLGVSQSKLLDHAADIFDSADPDGMEYAVIDLAERGSHSPVRRSDCEEELSDLYKLSSTETNDLFTQSESIGFVDYESTGEDRLYFNGALFKREQADKAKRILENISQDEQQKMLEAEQLFANNGCVNADQLRAVLGATLWSKMHQIGYFEVSVLPNERGVNEFVTKPEALGKYIPNGLADMLDDAKALACSLTYGITKSSNSRGRINDPSALLGALIGRGYVEGRAVAIKKDYQLLEKRGVVQVTATDKGNRLTLLKTEVGEMAKDLILKGDASGTAAEMIVGSDTSNFYGPETSRNIERKKEIPEAKAATARSLNILRKQA